MFKHTTKKSSFTKEAFYAPIKFDDNEPHVTPKPKVLHAFTIFQDSNNQAAPVAVASLTSSMATVSLQSDDQPVKHPVSKP